MSPGKNDLHFNIQFNFVSTLIDWIYLLAPSLGTSYSSELSELELSSLKIAESIQIYVMTLTFTAYHS